MFLLPERNIPIPLSCDEVWKSGDWGGGSGKACPNHCLGGPTERRGQPERGGGRNADSHTHISWVLLRDGEEEGVTCWPKKIKQKEFDALSVAALPTVSVQESSRVNRGSNKVILFTRWGGKNPNPTSILLLMRNVGLEGTKCMSRGLVDSNYFFRLYVEQRSCFKTGIWLCLC